MSDEQKPHYWSLLEQVLDEALNKRYEERKTRRKNKVKFSASNAGFCKRATILNRVNAKEEDVSPQTKRVFWLGEIIHSGVTELLKTIPGRLIAFEQYVSDYSDDIGAKFDFILRDDGGLNELNELKSVTDGGLWAKILKSKEPDKHHIFQALTYWIKNRKYRVDRLVISYIAKESANMKVFRVDITPEILKEVNEWWESVRDAYRTQTLPPKLELDTPEYKKFCVNYKCTYFREYCFGEETEMVENINQLEWK